MKCFFKNPSYIIHVPCQGEYFTALLIEKSATNKNLYFVKNTCSYHYHYYFYNVICAEKMVKLPCDMTVEKAIKYASLL